MRTVSGLSNGAGILVDLHLGLQLFSLRLKKLHRSGLVSLHPINLRQGEGWDPVQKEGCIALHEQDSGPN